MGLPPDRLHLECQDGLTRQFIHIAVDGALPL